MLRLQCIITLNMTTLVYLSFLLVFIECATSFLVLPRISMQRSQVREPTTALSKSSSSLSNTYEHDGWTLSFRFQPASIGYELERPIVLVHPVGIGMNSWFWERFLENWSGPAVYAPDLIGCGVANGGDMWDPYTRGLSFPLGWVQGVESLLQQKVLTRPAGTFGSLPSLGIPSERGCVIVAQGGLAPVGVMLAARNPTTVSHLVLTSPPTWSDMTTAVPSKELSRNFNILSSPIIGQLAFRILESPWAVAFFSNAFLFQGKCDERWLVLACQNTTAADRPPVIAFNAGFCNHRSFDKELTELTQPTLILCGKADKPRTKKRTEYVTLMSRCVIEELNGKNILPWESPVEVVEAIKNACYKN